MVLCGFGVKLAMLSVVPPLLVTAGAAEEMVGLGVIPIDLEAVLQAIGVVKVRVGEPVHVGPRKTEAWATPSIVWSRRQYCSMRCLSAVRPLEQPQLLTCTFWPSLAGRKLVALLPEQMFCAV